MIIIGLVAFDDNMGIGYQGKLPWHLPEDLKWFRSVTMGQTIIMGRKTFEECGPLKGRHNIVLTSKDLFLPGITTVKNIWHALIYANTEFVFVCGGKKVYEEFLYSGLMHKLCITKVHGIHKADRFFPRIPTGVDWKRRELTHNKKFDRFVLWREKL